MPDVDAFFTSYRGAFERFDAPAIVEHFAFPLHITGDGEEVGLTVASTEQEWMGQIERLVGMYRSIGVATAKSLEMVVTEVSPRVVQARMHWELRDAKGAAIYDFLALYTLARVGGALRIAAIAHNETPRAREAMARLRQRP